MNARDEQYHEFLVESHENLNQLDQDLVALEQHPRDRSRLSSVFRTIHTIKGTCGFFGFDKLESVTHVGENLLSLLRDGDLVLDAEITTALLTLVDAVREILAQIESTGKEGNGDYSSLISVLTRLAAAPDTQSCGDAQADPRATLLPQGPMGGEVRISEPVPAPRSPTSVPATTPTPVASPTPPTSTASKKDSSGILAESNVRVDVGLLDKLMNLVGELVLARNQILQHTASQTDPGIFGATQRLSLITTELQEGVMKTRMQPIGTVWNRFPRIVRDLAAQCGKRVRIEMDGQNTELDRTIVEAIRDPLTHVIRNSVDHGIEQPNARVAAGKPLEGRLLLRAFHEGGQVNIEISDDGNGIDPEKVKAKAIARGLLDRDQATWMSDREAIQLVFLPGFSTAETVTSVSGRGVGMDVVRTNIEKIGGAIDLKSRPGIGTTLKIKIPLTLAIIPALVVTTAGDRFCIPQVNLLELVRLEGELARRGIERLHDVLVYRLRGQLLPLVDLNQQLKLPFCEREVVNIVILQADGRPFGLIVDGVNDTEEIVVKPLGKHLKGLPLFAGATIMGDGKVALILDVLGLAQHAAITSENRDRRQTQPAEQGTERRAGVRHLLLTQTGSRRLAIPLGLVARLEEVPYQDVEDSGGQEVVQYRDRIMPLVRLANFLGCASSVTNGPAERLQVVVYSEDGWSVGLVVDRILDVVETAVELQPGTRRTGIEGAVIIQQRVTDLLDLRGLVRAAVPAVFAEETA